MWLDDSRACEHNPAPPGRECGGMPTAPPASPAEDTDRVALSFNSFHRFIDKARRRARAIAGRPDTTPWVLSPRTCSGSDRYVDFIIALDYLSPNSRLLRLFHEAFAAMQLSVLLVNKSNVHDVFRRVRGGRIRPHVYLDLSSRPGDVFEQLLYAAHGGGAYAIRHPERTDWIYKARAHPLLQKAGLPLPPTIIIRHDEPDRALTPAELALVGDPCVIKPSYGEAGKGARLRVSPDAASIASAREYNRADDWLVQKFLTFARCGEHPAYFRAYSILGQRSLLWWSLERKGYDALNWQDIERYDLLELFDLVGHVADQTGMDFFSTEIAGVADESAPNGRRWLLVDYVNDQCDMDPAGSASGGVPEAWASAVCRRFADFTHRQKHNLPPDTADSVFLLPDAPCVNQAEV